MLYEGRSKSSRPDYKGDSGSVLGCWRMCCSSISWSRGAPLMANTTPPLEQLRAAIIKKRRGKFQKWAPAPVQHAGAQGSDEQNGKLRLWVAAAPTLFSGPSYLGLPEETAWRSRFRRQRGDDGIRPERAEWVRSPFLQRGPEGSGEALWEMCAPARCLHERINSFGLGLQARICSCMVGPRTFWSLNTPRNVIGSIYRVRHKYLPIRKVKASHDLIFLARGTKFWHARDAHVPLEYAKYKTFQCSSYATMARTSTRERSWNKGRGFTDVRVIKQQNNHIKRSETLQSDRCCQQDYSAQEEVGTCEEGGRSYEEEDL